jgi:hypothetical protein
MEREAKRRLTRRSFLTAAGVGALVAVPLARAGMRWASTPDGVFVSASDDLDGRHFITASDLTGRQLFSVEVETRCHGVVLDPVRPHRAIVVARRPGVLAYDVDLASGTVARRLRSADDRHFYGHAVFSHDGSVLYTSENDIPKSEGVVSVRDAQDLRVLGELRTRGVGPHELLLLGDGNTLVVANGGLVTDLADGTRRRDLNIPTMDPSLVHLDVRDGRLLVQARPDDHFASGRHLAAAADGTVAVAMQYEGPETNPYPVIGFHRGGDRIVAGEAPRDVLVRMKRYSASVCVAPSGVAAATCPRGDLVALYDVASGRLVRTHEIRDAGGVAVSPDGRAFVVTTGLGEVHLLDTRTLDVIRAPERRPEVRWDNHAVALQRL